MFLPVRMAVVILVDKPIYWFRGRQWCHMVSDADLGQLHGFAQALGIPRRAFQDPPHRNHPHYDVPAELHVLALERGAQQVTGRELVTRMIRHRSRSIVRGPMVRRVSRDESAGDVHVMDELRARIQS